MDSKKVAIWVLSIVLAAALIFGTILFMQNRKMKKQLGTPVDYNKELQDYINTLPIYLSNADAVTHGLKVGDKYRKTSTATDYEIVTA